MRNHPFRRFGLAATFAAVTALGAAGSVSAATCDAEDELLIGDHQPLSGASAAFGEQTYRGVILAIKHYNDGTHPMNPTPCLEVRGKKYKLKTVVYDNKYTAEGGIAAANRLVFEDGAKYSVGSVGSGPSVAASDAVFEPNEIIFVVSIALGVADHVYILRNGGIVFEGSPDAFSADEFTKRIYLAG